MSGGSFDYLYDLEDHELFRGLAQLNHMAEALTEAGAHDAAEETERIIAFIEHSLRQIKARRKRLDDVWKAMEWWKSCDTSEDAFKASLEQYREGGI